MEVAIDYENSNQDFGELIVYGPNVMKGYWKDPVESSMYFGFDSEREKAYLRTGDIFRMDDDGFLYFIGRKSEFIKCNGHRISGVEIDSYLIRMVPQITECCTVGMPHSQMGQEIVTIICGEPDRDRLSEMLDQLPRYMRPHRVIVQDQPLPKNTNGKFDKQRIREIVK